MLHGCVIPLLRYRGVKSVYEFLKEKGGLAVLNDANVEIATREVLANGRSRPQITKDIRRKVRRNSFFLLLIAHATAYMCRACLLGHLPYFFAG